MEFTIHNQVLLLVFALAMIMGGVAKKTNFCTMGGVSDWVNMGDRGRFCAWVFAMAVAMAGLLALEGMGIVNFGEGTFPPYRTENFAWLRYILGGLMFGVGMTLGSGCGNKMLVRIGGGNLKSLVVLAITAGFAYLMMFTAFSEKVFLSWIGPTTVNLASHGVASQEVSDILAGMTGAQGGKAWRLVVGAAIAIGLFAFVFRSKDFRENFDNILGGGVIGLVVVAGWYITGGSIGQAWKEWADLAPELPSRVQVQSFTFISPMGDTVRYLMSPTQLTLVNFGVMALSGVIFGSLVYALAARKFRLEWFRDGRDFANHALGAVLMGTGGALSMGCTVGQAITGVSTVAFGSFITFLCIALGAAATIKYQYWRMMQEA